MNQNTQCMFILLTQILSWIYFAYNFTGNYEKNNVIKLVPLNPNVSLAEKDGIKRSLFRNDDILLNIVKSKEFQEILLTDPTTLDGEEKIVKYFGFTD